MVKVMKSAQDAASQSLPSNPTTPISSHIGVSGLPEKIGPEDNRYGNKRFSLIGFTSPAFSQDVLPCVKIYS
jgi:hypothetical protein